MKTTDNKWISIYLYENIYIYIWNDFLYSVVKKNKAGKRKMKRETVM